MPNELYHHGINGQRWGFRRFQNEDGSLTPEGELRYNQGKQKAARGKAAEMYKTKKYKAKLALKQEKQKVKDAAALAKTAKKEQAKLNAEDRVIKKKAKNMTDEELRNEVNRLAMELDYQKKSWQVQRGKKGPSSLDKLDDFFERPTGKIVAEVGKNVVQNVAQTTLNRMIEERTSILKKTQIENAKKTGEKTQLEIDELKAKKSKEENNSSETKSESSKNNTKSAEDYVKEALNKNNSEPTGFKDTFAKNTYNTVNVKDKYKDFSNKINKKVNLGNVKTNDSNLKYGSVISGKNKKSSNSSFSNTIIYGSAPKVKISLIPDKVSSDSSIIYGSAPQKTLELSANSKVIQEQPWRDRSKTIEDILKKI